MLRIAAAGDVHFDRHSRGRLADHFGILKEKADLFLLAGDLTQTGHPEEAKVLADDLKESPVPVVAVLGNHDYQLDSAEKMFEILKDAQVHVLEKACIKIEVRGFSVGIAGVKGFGGGFVGACGTEFGEREMKDFIGHSRIQAQYLEKSLSQLDTHYKIALMHYSPTAQTLLGEKKEIYPFLGSYFLAEAVDRGGADVVFHGHAHKGTEKGQTLGGVPVRNVAQPVIGHAYHIYTLNKASRELSEPIRVAERMEINRIYSVS